MREMEEIGCLFYEMMTGARIVSGHAGGCNVPVAMANQSKLASTSRLGAQRCPRRVLVALVPHTVDLDISNCMFTIVHQLLNMQEPTDVPEDVRDVIRRCAEERDEVSTAQGVALWIWKGFLTDDMDRGKCAGEKCTCSCHRASPYL